MANDGQIVFEVTADGRRAVADIQNITREIQSQTRNWDNAVNNSTQDMTRAMNKAFDVNRIKNWGVQIAKAVFNFGKDALEAAGGKPVVSKADLAYIFYPFPQTALQVNYWEADEDFPAQVKVLVDSRITDYVHIETTGCLVSDLFEHIKACKKA